MLVDYLKKVFSDRAKANSAYSLRAFAKSLDIDSSSLSAILSRKRPVSLKTAKKLIDGLKIADPKEAQMLILATLTGDASAAETRYGEFSVEISEMISSWEHFAILALLEIRNQRWTPKTISARLNIPIAVALDCLARLQKLGLAESLEKHAWAVTGKDMGTPTDIPNTAIREGNRQYIQKAMESLTNDPVDLREISGITIAVSRAKLKDAKKLIKDFQMRLATFLESGHKTSVYRFNVQLFPLSKDGA